MSAEARSVSGNVRLRSDEPPSRFRIGVYGAFTIAGLVAIGIALSRLDAPDPENAAPTAARETARANLETRDGLVYARTETAPFTGMMVERYPSGALKTRSEMVAGRLHGLSEAWHSNGRLQARERFAHGLSHGRRAKWRANGTRLSESEIVEGRHHGVFRRWHPNGRLAEHVEMRQGRPEGLALSYYASGHVKARAVMRDGVAERLESWADGERAEPPADLAKL